MRGPATRPSRAVFPANGASVPLNPNGVEVRYTCPEAYIIAGEPPFATYGGRDDYGVDFASAPALGNNGRLLESNVIDRAGDDPVQDNDIPIGQCRGYLTRATGPGVVYWQAWRLCLACPGSYETAEVRSMRLTTSGSGLRIAAKWPRTAYARYPFHVSVTSSGIRAGTTVELQARRGTRWRKIATITLAADAGDGPAGLARGRHQVRAIVRAGSEINNGRFQLSLLCPTPGMVSPFTTIVADAPLSRARIAPDGSFAWAGVISGHATYVHGRIQGNRASGRARLSLRTCSGSGGWTARRG